MDESDAADFMSRMNCYDVDDKLSNVMSTPISPSKVPHLNERQKSGISA